MPLYEYECDACGSVFEVMQKFSDEPLAVHESCGGRVHRLLSAPALQFKGSGWYITDYARGGKSSESNGTKTESKGDGAAKTEAKSDAGSTNTAKSAETKS
jgi:putative FmdB family regulatory protein